MGSYQVSSPSELPAAARPRHLAAEADPLAALVDLATPPPVAVDNPADAGDDRGEASPGHSELQLPYWPDG